MQLNALCPLEVQGMVVCPHVETFATGIKLESSDQIPFRVPIKGSKISFIVKINRSRTHHCNLTFDPLKIKPLHKGTINWSKTKSWPQSQTLQATTPWSSVVIYGVGRFLFYYPRNFRAVVLVVSFVDVSHEKRYLWQCVASWIQRHGVDFSIQNSSDPRRRGRSAGNLQTGSVYLASFPPSQFSSSPSLAEESRRYLKAAILHSNTSAACKLYRMKLLLITRNRLKFRSNMNPADRSRTDPVTPMNVSSQIQYIIRTLKVEVAPLCTLTQLFLHFPHHRSQATMYCACLKP